MGVLVFVCKNKRTFYELLVIRQNDVVLYLGIIDILHYFSTLSQRKGTLMEFCINSRVVYGIIVN